MFINNINHKRISAKRPCSIRILSTACIVLETALSCRPTEKRALLTPRSVYFRVDKTLEKWFHSIMICMSIIIRSPNQEKYLPFLTGPLRAELKLELLLFSPTFVPLQFCHGSSNIDCLKYSLAGGFQGPLPPPPKDFLPRLFRS